jgi:WD40 repeat protein
MEIFSEAILAKVQVPEGIQSLAFHEGRLFAGSQSGVIYSIDLDIYSSHQTSQMGVTVKRRRLDEETKEDRVFPDLSSSECYKAELRGHEKGVTSLAPFAAESVSFLVSGDESGSLRIWDLESRGCVRIIQPWSFSVRSPSESENSKASSSSGSSTLHPITSILVVPLDDDRNMEQSDIFAVPSSTKESKTDAASSLFTPLKRFPNQMDENNPMSSWLTVAFFRPKLTKDSFLFQTPMSPPELKPSNVTEEHSSGVVAALRQELAEARARLQKLEDMNSELKNQLEGKAA